MWDAIRKKYNNHYGSGVMQIPPSNFEANNKHIAQFSSKPNPKEQDPNSCTPAYGSLLYTKLSKLTNSDNQILILKSLTSLQELYKSDLKHISASLLYSEEDLIDNLVALIREEFSKVESLKTLCYMNKLKFSREKLLKSIDIITSTILVDYETEKEEAIYLILKLLKGASVEKSGAEFIVNIEDVVLTIIKCLDYCFEKGKESSLNVKIFKHGFVLLNNLLAVEKTYGLVLEENIIINLIEKILKKKKPAMNISIMVPVIECVALLSFYHEGRVKCVKFLPLILPYLDHKENEILLLQVTNAVMQLTISVNAKYLVMSDQPSLRDFVLRKCFEVFDLNLNNHYIFVNYLKIICNLAEKERKPFYGLLIKIEEKRVLFKENELIIEELQNTFNVISWKA